PLATRVLGGDPGGAAVGVATLGLDAADGHHHRASGVGEVGALDDALDDVIAGGDLPGGTQADALAQPGTHQRVVHGQDRKSTRLNSSHVSISYAVFCLKKKIAITPQPSTHRLVR